MEGGPPRMKKRSRSRVAAIAGLVGVFPALVLAALLVFEFSVPADALRARAATALSDALGCPSTIGGSLHLITGMQPGIEGRDVRLAECRSLRVSRASADTVRARLSLRALFSREIELVEITGEQDRKSTRLNSSHMSESRMPSSA